MFKHPKNPKDGFYSKTNEQTKLEYNQRAFIIFNYQVFKYLF